MTRRTRGWFWRADIFSWLLLGWGTLLGSCKNPQSEQSRPLPEGVCQPPADGASAPPTERNQDCTLKPASHALADLLAYEDTDSDRRITLFDQGAGHFALPLEGGGSYPISGTYHLANLVQELFLAHIDGRSQIALGHIEEPIADRLSRLITERYWANLSRRIDGDELGSVLADAKIDPKKRIPTNDWPQACTPAPEGIPQFLYVPHADERALDFYRSLRTALPALVVCRLPREITPDWVRSLDATEKHGSLHGLLSLAIEKKGGQLQAVPYGVPGGRFNEMYGWDSYFHVLGLLEDQKVELARSLVQNQLYEVHHYGKVLNANRTYYLTRSQPPFLSSAVRAIWQHTKQSDPKWLESALAELIAEYQNVWNSGERLTPLCQAVSHSIEQQKGQSQRPAPSEQVCLASYHAQGRGEPPEVEPGHFDWLYQKRAAAKKQDPQRYRQRYRERSLPKDELAELDWKFMQDRSMRESGHDTTYRWSVQGEDSCADFATIDLNSLLFKVELDLAQLSKEAHHPDWHKWCDRASARRDLVLKYLYNGELFVDYRLDRDAQRHFSSTGSQSSYLSATTLYPLWASAESPCKAADGTPLSLLASQQQSKRLVAAALRHLESPGGLASTARASLAKAQGATARQWDYPYGWAPHQILAWQGLRSQGFHQEADRLTYRWLYMISKNARDFHGTLPEKYDVARRTHQVFAEYGNVGADFSYITREGFGWMNASFQIGRASLSDKLRRELSRLTPPQKVKELW